MNPTIEPLIRDIQLQLDSLLTTNTEEKRKELIKILELLIQQLRPVDNTPKQASCANYII